MDIWEKINELTGKIIGAAIEVHRHLGPGLLESAYHHCLLYELKKLGLKVTSQLGLPLMYKEVCLDTGYRLDLLVEGLVLVEIKSVEALNDHHTAQVLTYLKFSGAQVGLLINFNVCKLTDGIKRLRSRVAS